MTCEEFERVVTDLACEFLIEAATRKRGLAHALACSRCSARLQQEHSLTAALSDVASTETVLAPAQVKTALLAAFQQQNTAAAVAAPSVFVTAPPRRRPRWLMAAAAAVALIAILVALQILRQSSRVAAPTNSQSVIAKGATPNVMPETNRDGTQSLPQSTVKNTQDVQSAAAHKEVINDAPRPSPMHRRKWRIFRPELASATHSPDTSETVTEFIPLTEDVDARAAVQNGTIVRVQLVRASLIAMGLPVNAERAQELVKADIVVGDDGLARAIRLVY